MDRLSDLKLRRIPALLLFFILGPMLLLGVFGLVCYRKSSISRIEEEINLSNLIHLQTTLVDAEYVRPKTKAYFGLCVHTVKTGTPFIFCPEILIRPLKNEDSIFSPSLFEEYGAAGTEQAAAEQDREEWLIPDLYILTSEWRNLESFFHAGNTRFPKGGIYFRIGRVHFINSDTLWMLSEYQRPRHRFSTNIATKLSEIGNTKHRGANPQDGNVSKGVAQFSSNEEESILEQVRGVWIRPGADNLVSFDFRFLGITSVNPSSLTLFQHGKLQEPSEKIPSAPQDESLLLSWHLRSDRSPIPLRFLAIFKPGLENWGNNCWLTGDIFSHTKQQNEKEAVRHTELNNLYINHGILSTLLSQARSTRMEGIIDTLLIRNGTISNNIFLGEGQLHLVNAAFEKDFLARFQNEFALKFTPPNTLIHIFPENMVRFDEIQFDFAFLDEGVSITASNKSNNSQSAISGYRKTPSLQYEFTLPTEGEKVVPYPRFLGTLTDKGESFFWSRFYRDALNHLPVGE